MTGKLPPRDWSDIDASAIAPADAARWIAVLPLAATEQHGPHLPVTTDVDIAQAYLARVRSILPQDTPATFLPIEKVGISTEHIDFEGTLTLPPDQAIRDWIGIGASLAKAGLRKLVIVTSHGGNSAAMTIVAQELRAHHRMLAVTTSWGRLSAADKLFADDEVRFGIHGGAVEMSIMLAHAPYLVRRDAIANFESSARSDEARYRWLSASRPAPYAWQAQDLHPSGAVGDATLASAEKGEALLDAGARAFCELLGDVDNFDVSGLVSKPSARS